MCTISHSLVPIFYFALIFAVVQSFPLFSADRVINKCLAENNITQEEYEAVMNDTSTEDDDGNIERKFKCWIHCLASEFELLDDEGNLDLGFMDRFDLQNDTIRNEVIECKELYDGMDDSCEYAFNMVQCMRSFDEDSNESE